MRDDAIAMIMRCMRHQSAAAAWPEIPVPGGRSNETGDTPILARVEGEGIVEGARQWAQGERVINDHGELVDEPVSGCEGD